MEKNKTQQEEDEDDDQGPEILVIGCGDSKLSEKIY